MSKIGKMPINIPTGVEVKLQDGVFDVKGKQGNLSIKLLQYLSAEIKDNIVRVSALGTHKQGRSNWGTMTALLKNAVVGVSEGFGKALEIQGVGYRASMEGNVLVLNVGFTHPIKFTSPEGIKISVEKNIIKVNGASKELVGEVAAQIRKFKKPEPYKGKGIMYKGEVIRRKAGKKVAGAGTAAA